MYRNTNVTPKFIIAGAAKAGTSSLSNYLGEHPGIFMTAPKELDFFLKERSEQDLKDYLNYFNDSKSLIAGEGSVSYLAFSDISFPQIKKYFPQIKLIIMLRNPIERYYSEFWFNISRGAIVYKKNMFDDIITGKYKIKDPGAINKDYRNWLIEKGLYAKHIKNVLKYFDRSQIHIIYFEDFVSKTNEELDKVFNFLDIKSLPVKSSSTIHNKTSYPGNMFKIYLIWKKIKKALPKKLVVKYRKHLVFIKNMFFNNKKPELSNLAKEKLHEIYFESIIELEELLDIDLSHWKK